jgi:integral membrane sensor domain MASE1
MPDDHKNSEKSKQTLDYHAVDGGATGSMLGCLGGFFLSATCCLWGLSLYETINSPATPDFIAMVPKEYLAIAVGFTPPILVLAAAFVHRIRRRRNGFLIGALIGAGILGLLFGTCTLLGPIRN